MYLLILLKWYLLYVQVVLIIFMQHLHFVPLFYIHTFPLSSIGHTCLFHFAVALLPLSKYFTLVIMFTFILYTTSFLFSKQHVDTLLYSTLAVPPLYWSVAYVILIHYHF